MISCAHNHYLHYGSGLPIFKAVIRQDRFGLGAIVDGLIKAVPVLNPMVKTIAKTALTTGGRVLSDVVIQRKPFKEALMDNKKSRRKKRVGRKRRQA